jgi:hypothetical protein
LRDELAAVRSKGSEVLAHRRTAEIIEAIDVAARQLVAPGGAYHEELVDVLPGLTGYSPEMIALGLERMGNNWTTAALREAIVSELGSLDVLDGFEPRPAGGRQRAFGPSLTVHVFSGNIPGISVSSLIRALCVRSASFGKTAAGEPYLAVCFARALAEVDAGLADCIAVAYWPGGSEDLERVAFSEAEAVIAYGGDEAISRIGGLVPPAVRFLPYPNRVGAAFISKSALRGSGTDTLAKAAATDVATFDQQGCVAPHTLYVQRGGEVAPGDFAGLVASALDEMSRSLPRGSITPGESSLIHQLRAQAEVRGAEVLASERGTEWTVIIEEREAFEPSPLNRVIHVHIVDDLAQGVEALARVGRHLQTVAIAAEQEEVLELADRLGAIGATRLVPVGEAAWPLPTWHHDGRFQFMDLLRFVDLDL